MPPDSMAGQGVQHAVFLQCLGHFPLNAELELRFTFRDLPNLEPEHMFQFGVRTCSNLEKNILLRWTNFCRNKMKMARYDPPKTPKVPEKRVRFSDSLNLEPELRVQFSSVQDTPHSGAIRLTTVPTIAWESRWGPQERRNQGLTPYRAHHRIMQTRELVTLPIRWQTAILPARQSRSLGIGLDASLLGQTYIQGKMAKDLHLPDR
ncbi:hypothetical protein B0H10DRAFT_2322205 [Mycena sp. CBHHK59/15]|nr:hypothetical protein B0H10DRAFT_2322205 [Mycena sp. CBHHK59/15]